VYECRLFQDQQVDGFNCGNDSLNRWLLQHAKSAQGKRTARVFVWTDAQDDQVRGYFTLSAHEIVAADLPARLSRGMPDKLPAVLLGKLALHTSLHGRGLGGQLLRDAYERVLHATQSVAARFLVVDAVDDSAVAFYRHYGFNPLPEPQHARLVRKISDIEADLRE
jgi:GNAT superfamily N-acetyltransferase